MTDHNMSALKKSHQRRLGLAAAALTALAALAGCGAGTNTAAVPTVAVVPTVRTRLSNSMTFQGEFSPFQDVLIHAKVSGYVNPIRVDIGDRVKTGELLATLEVPELGDQLAGARATARRLAAEQAIAHLNYGRLAEVAHTQANLVAQQDLDDASAKDGAATAALATANAEVDRLATLMDYTRVLAPFPGVITKRFVDNGSLVDAGTTASAGPVVELAESDLLRLRFPVPEAETPLIQIGGSVQIAVGALNVEFTGKIARDAWAIDRSTRTMIAEVDVPNSAGRFKAGMYAAVTLRVQNADDVLAVPLQAVSAGDNPTILIVTADHTIAERPVTLGIRTASLVEIRSGLANGDLVVVGDRTGLANGTRVVPKLIDPPSGE